MTFDEVYRTHLQAVLRAARRAAGREDVAEEITADAFLELYLRFDRIEADRLPGWLITVVRNRAIDYWRHQQLERRFTEQLASVAPAAPPVAASAIGERLLASPWLKTIHRACLSMRYREGMTREEIGAQLGLSATQVRGHLQYGLTLLRRHMAPAGSRVR